MSVFNADGYQGHWPQQIGAAKLAWSKLSEQELLKCEGHPMQLASLVQQRYGLTPDEADRQVRVFIEQCKE